MAGRLSLSGTAVVILLLVANAGRFLIKSVVLLFCNRCLLLGAAYVDKIRFTLIFFVRHVLTPFNCETEPEYDRKKHEKAIRNRAKAPFRLASKFAPRSSVQYAPYLLRTELTISESIQEKVFLINIYNPVCTFALCHDFYLLENLIYEFISVIY